MGDAENPFLRVGAKTIIMSEKVNGVADAEFMNLNEAFYRITNRADRNLSRDEGFVLNLADLRAYINQIDSYNVGKEGDLVVEGIRVWKSRQKIEGVCHDDVLFSPVNFNASDIHMINSTAPTSPSGSELLLMGSLRPCPINCGPNNPILITSYSPTATDTKKYNKCSAYPKT